MRTRPNRPGGELPSDVTAAHAKRARELGLYATNMPAELGGGGCSALQQVLVQEQMGRVTNALGWVAATPPSWLPPVATPAQLDVTSARPSRASARSATRSPRRAPGPTWTPSWRPPAGTATSTCLNGEKWHVTSYNTADYAFFQGKLTGGAHDGEHAMFLVDLPSPGVRVVRTPAYYAHDQPPPPDRGVRRRAGAGRAPGRRRGRRDELRLRVVPVRAADGGRALPGRGRAADRRDDRLRGRAAGAGPPDQSSSAWSRPCWPTA